MLRANRADLRQGAIEAFVGSFIVAPRKDDGEAAAWTFLPLLPVPRGDERERALVLSEIACRIALPVALRVAGEPKIAMETADLPPLWAPNVPRHELIARRAWVQTFFR